MSKDTLKDCLEKTCASRGDAPAIEFLRKGRLETLLSYRQLNRDADRMARRFVSMGVEKGDRVVLFMGKSLAFLTAHFALQKIGGISTPLNPGFKQSEMEYLLGDADPKAILCEPDKKEMVAEICPAAQIVTVDIALPYPQSDLFGADRRRHSPGNRRGAGRSRTDHLHFRDHREPQRRGPHPGKT